MLFARDPQVCMDLFLAQLLDTFFQEIVGHPLWLQLTLLLILGTIIVENDV